MELLPLKYMLETAATPRGYDINKPCKIRQRPQVSCTQWSSGCFARHSLGRYRCSASLWRYGKRAKGSVRTRKPSTMVSAFASRMVYASARLLLAAAVFCCSVETVRSEAAHHGAGGSMIRVGTETPFALATEEKEFTSTLLHRWGLGSQRLFAELAGAMQCGIQPFSTVGRFYDPNMGQSS